MLNENAIEGIKAQYDVQVKKLLSQKIILAWILKKTVSEMKDLTEEEIEKCIEGEPDLSGIALDEGHSNREISGDNTESSIVGEGTVYYDIRFRVNLPEKKGALGLLINVEAQKDMNPGYDIESRGIYYCARMVSSQKEKEFTGSHYNDIKKVYSIWICMNSPRSIGNSISSYRFTKRDLLGNIPDRVTSYDKMELVLITLNEEETEDSFLQKIQILLSDRMEADQKTELLRKVHGVDIGTDAREVIHTMCNLSESIYEKGNRDGYSKGNRDGYSKGNRDGYNKGNQDGYNKGIEQGINAFVKLVNDQILTVEEAAKRLEMSVASFVSYMRNHS